ncbi:MAG: dihydrolipoyl dehydrogenase [Candidatus Mesenet longicola]|uniref:Dihydrolipoyl dehydrogenase n=1 Tax=Candidatus Mesenet longicola TaxID=1892558 RepID=A0A8J3HTM7_9RICK|nr:MAG: dihydrolipoyl dehydrogenase [Candidatus Mesenet longicola]GHM60053.1 MAG: dihydrolipoyl dehydrogenase [Candidatus Mesenet longicola]
MTGYDLVIIGSGPGGYVAAIRAAQLGLKTALVEKEENLGGVCLNWGCIPTKSLLKTSELYHSIKKAKDFGIEVKDISFNIENVVKRSRDVVAKLASGISYLMNKYSIAVHKGFGRIVSKNTVDITNGKEKISAKHIILATGARARNLPGIEVDNNLIWNAKSAMVPKVLPKSLLIIGSGAIGIEFASFYNTMGSKVIIVEAQDRILPLEDQDISKLAQDIFAKQGMEIYTSSTAKVLNKKNDSVELSIIDNKGKSAQIEVDRVLLAVGVQPNSEDIGLEHTKIVKDNLGFIKTNQWYETAEPGIYAIGDVAGNPCLAHKASHEGVICAEKIAGKSPVCLKKENIPSCIYSYPQIASVGLTEKQAIENGYEIKIGKFFSNFNGKSIVIGENEGMVKTIIDKKTGELLGAHMIGAEVTEMISTYVVSRQLEAVDLDIKSSIFPHPTLSEMMHESVLCADDESLSS